MNIKDYTLNPSNIWISQGLKTLDDFKQKLPEIQFIDLVPPDVVKFFKIIQKLLIHSYFEYEFIDVAFTKALTGFEMALKIRYKELTGEAAKMRLYGLIKWGIKNNLFEFDDSIDIIREIRNFSVHPNDYHFAGLTLFNSFSTIVDTINGLYLDPLLRKERKNKTEKVNTILDDFTKDGAILEIPDKRLIIFNAKMLFLDNIPDPNKYYFQFWPIFDVPTPEAKEYELPKPLRLISGQWKYIDDVFFSDDIKLIKITEEHLLHRFQNFLDQFNNHHMLHFYLKSSMGKESRELYSQLLHRQSNKSSQQK